MAGWFDDYAKRSSRQGREHARAPQGRTYTRRQVVVRGSVTVAAAWAAPTLMSSPAYAYGVSNCATNRVCGASTELQYCCPGAVTGTGATYQCTKDASGANGCAAAGTPGGNCTNNGSGTSGCSQGTYCNGNASSNDCNCTANNICGGNGATCDTTAQTPCAPGYACSNGHCRPTCATTAGCPSGLLSSGSFTCTSGVCQTVCSTKQDCPNGQNCTNNRCI